MKKKLFTQTQCGAPVSTHTDTRVKLQTKSNENCTSDPPTYNSFLGIFFFPDVPCHLPRRNAV